VAPLLPFGTTVWLEQKPDCPENGFDTCPDCGGTGDLSSRIEQMGDTRDIPMEFEPFSWAADGPGSRRRPSRRATRRGLQRPGHGSRIR
jgi:hypothetical protein